MELNMQGKGFTILKAIPDSKKAKEIKHFVSKLLISRQKMNRRRSSWQLARSLSSVDR